NVMEGQHQDMLAASAFHQDQPDQRPFLKVELFPAFGLMQKPYFLVWVVQTTEVEIRNREPEIRGYLLHRLFSDHIKTGPQHLMPPENAIDRLFKSRQRKVTTNLQGACDVVSGPGIPDIFEQPQGLLGKRKRKQIGRAEGRIRMVRFS